MINKYKILNKDTLVMVHLSHTGVRQERVPFLLTRDRVRGKWRKEGKWYRAGARAEG